MKIYVAGKFEDYKEVQRVYEAILGYGHSITYDWTRTAKRVVEQGYEPTEQFEANCCEMDIWGVKSCHTLIALHHPEALGTIVEIGMALGLGKQVWLVGPWKHSVFWREHNVYLYKDYDEMKEALWRTSSTK